MQKLNDLSQSLTPLDPDGTLIAVIEMSQSSWLVAGIVPGVERRPLKKLAVDESALLNLLNRWRVEAEKAGRKIERIAVAFEAGRDGFKRTISASPKALSETSGDLTHLGQTPLARFPVSGRHMKVSPRRSRRYR